MNPFYIDYIARGKALAEREGLNWYLSCDTAGRVPDEQRWNISQKRNMSLGTVAWVQNLGTFRNAIAPRNQLLGLADSDAPRHGAMSRDWIDFYLATLLSGVFDGDQKPHSVLVNTGQPLRILAACCSARRPSDLRPEDIQLAYNVALRIGSSGKFALNFRTVVRTTFDYHHLLDSGPLASYCTPYPDETSIDRHLSAERQRTKQNAHRKAASRKTLEEKKATEKLPDMEAFREMIRIVFTSKPETFSDAVRFNLYKLMVLTGFRVGEALRLPDQCLRKREYFDRQGGSPASKGGIATSLALRYFAEKQTADINQDGFVLVENVQDVPKIFEDIVTNMVAETQALTAAPRKRLEMQMTSARYLPEFQPNDFVPDWQLYLRLSGNIRLGAEPLPVKLVSNYRENFSVEALDELRSNQIAAYHRCPNPRILEYFEKWAKKAPYLTFRTPTGTPAEPCRGGRYSFKVSEIERYIADNLGSKRPSFAATPLSSGVNVQLHDFLFLFPARSTIEDRDGGVLDIGNYAFFGIGSEMDLGIHLGLNTPNIFTRYGHDNARDYKINPHALRHLQNDELFRSGVSDTLITLRYGRRSTAQSHVYDHRSLAEDLDFMDVPDGAVDPISVHARRAFNLVAGGHVRGPIEVEFRRIQTEIGEKAAFDYLSAEAGGLHVTPYGYCLSSLTVDPCPKNLECFNDCKHLARTGLESETAALRTLRDQLIHVIERLESGSLATRGAQNQLIHAQKRLIGVEKALATPVGAPTTPSGTDRLRRFTVTHSTKVRANG